VPSVFLPEQAVTLPALPNGAATYGRHSGQCGHCSNKVEGGTVFIDEVGQFATAVQAKVLRVVRSVEPTFTSVEPTFTSVEPNFRPPCTNRHKLR